MQSMYYFPICDYIHLVDFSGKCTYSIPYMDAMGLGYWGLSVIIYLGELSPALDIQRPPQKVLF